MAATALIAPMTAHASETFADNAFTYSYGAQYRNPYIASASQPDGADIVRNALSFKHFDAWEYGHNFVDVLVKRSNDVEPAAGGGTGATGFYSILRSGLSVNRLAGRPIVSFGSLRDIDIQAGANLETKNTAFAPSERTLYLGPNLQIAGGSGYLNVGLYLRKEWNHNGALGKNENYDLGFNIEPYWGLPFRIGSAQFTFEGFAAYNTAKGRSVSGQQTRAELIVRPLLKFDLGAAMGGSPKKLEVGIAVEYWHNMFGMDADKVPGADQFTPVAALIVHL